MTNEAQAEMLARVLAGRLLMAAAQRSSAAMDSFSGWMITGFAGALTLILTNVGTVGKFVSSHSLQRGTGLFLGSVLIASVVASSVAASEDGERIVQQFGEKGQIQGWVSSSRHYLPFLRFLSFCVASPSRYRFGHAGLVLQALQ
jgi:hypothetical protein